ncbi:septum site-determining protein Ssd [Ruania alba]|uniref:Helicase/secretion neighborhood CpaE-like protein n=1 Tax=Ruania alba TaxID=648782 RepID=A0A1H5MQL5_9MICO|nr:septum site-determining protein Ssd [Ruania alba]SEE91037.1 helicase/secretion neighborhood CpaE-like protein [Ruania alba]
MSSDLHVVALRSADPAVIEAVREVVALVEQPVAIYAPGASPPAGARLLLDSVAEYGPADPDWVQAGGRTAWVSVGTPAEPGEGRLVCLPADAEELLALVRAASRQRQARVLGVVGARGGAGASCLAAALASVCADAGLGVALADLDLRGPGIDLLLGIEHAGGLRWADVADQRGAMPHDPLAAALPTWHGVHVLSTDWRGGPRETDGGDVIEALAAGHDVLVLDLPRTRTPWADLCDVVYVVTPCDVMSAAAARSLVSAWQGIDLRLVVRGPAPGGLTAAEIASACELPLALTMREERSLAAAIEHGVAPGEHRRGPLRRGARRVVHELSLVS